MIRFTACIGFSPAIKINKPDTKSANVKFTKGTIGEEYVKVDSGFTIGTGAPEIFLYHGEWSFEISDASLAEAAKAAKIQGSRNKYADYLEEIVEDVVFNNPKDARRAGVEVVYQDLALCDHLTAAKNIYLSRDEKKFGFLLDIFFFLSDGM